MLAPNKDNLDDQDVLTNWTSKSEAAVEDIKIIAAGCYKS